VRFHTDSTLEDFNEEPILTEGEAWMNDKTKSPIQKFSTLLFKLSGIRSLLIEKITRVEKNDGAWYHKFVVQ